MAVVSAPAANCLRRLRTASVFLRSGRPQILRGRIYAAVFVKLADRYGSSRFLWQGIDRDLIDATLDNSNGGAYAKSPMGCVLIANLAIFGSYAGWIAADAGCRNRLYDLDGNCDE